MSLPGALALILSSVALNASAQVLLRWGARVPQAEGGPAALALFVLRPGILAGLACYGLSLLIWLRVLREVDVSFAYPFLGLGFVLVALAGTFLLGEPMPPARMAGTALIVAGVVVLSLS